METNLFNMNNKIYSNNNNILLEIIKELNQIKSESNENLTMMYVMYRLYAIGRDEVIPKPGNMIPPRTDKLAHTQRE